MKLFSSLFLLVVMVYNSIGFIATMQYARHEWRTTIRKKLAEGVGKDVLIVFKFKNKKFNTKTKEFQHNGQWYDVVQVENNGDDYLVYAFDDATETQLTAQYHHILIKNNAEDNDFQSKTKQVFNNLIKEFLFKNTEKKMPPSVEWAFACISFDFIFFPLNPFQEFDYPPPKEILI